MHHVISYFSLSVIRTYSCLHYIVAHCERARRQLHTLYPDVLSFQSAQMSPKLCRIVLIVVTALAAVAGADLDPSLVGTWTTKSRKVITGPVLYSLCDDAGDSF